MKIGTLIALSLLLIGCQPNQKKTNGSDTDTTSTTSIAEEQEAPKMETYFNPKFGYAIDYPVGVLFPQEESTLGDGRAFKNKEGEDALIVYATSRTDIEAKITSLKEEFSETIRMYEQDSISKITYKKLGKTFFVISGYQGKKIFYQKTVQEEGIFVNAILYYKESEKTFYEGYIGKIFGSIK